MENKKLTPEIAELMKAYKAGKHSSDEEIALASLSVLDEYGPKPFPTPIKKVQDEYLKLKPDARKKMIGNPENYQGFWADPEVRKYFDDRERIKNLNSRNKEWLEWMKKVLPEQELPIRMKLHQFEDVTPAMEQPNWSE